MFREESMRLGVLLAMIGSAVGHVPRVAAQETAKVHVGALTVLPDSVNERWAGGRFVIFVARTAHDSVEWRLLETAERLFPERAVIEREAGAKTGSGNVHAFAKAAAMPGDRWWWREWDTVLLPYALTGATVEHYLARVRALSAGPSPFAAYESARALRVSFRYLAAVERATAPGVAYRVTLRMQYQLYCGPRCALWFTKDRVVTFDAGGRVLSVTGDGEPRYMVS